MSETWMCVGHEVRVHMCLCEGVQECWWVPGEITAGVSGDATNEDVDDDEARPEGVSLAGTDRNDPVTWSGGTDGEDGADVAKEDDGVGFAGTGRGDAAIASCSEPTR
jgi:hypothetical protein